MAIVEIDTTELTYVVTPYEIDEGHFLKTTGERLEDASTETIHNCALYHATAQWDAVTEEVQGVHEIIGHTIVD